MKYDKSLKTKKDKEMWKLLQGGVFSDIHCKCMELKKQGYTKLEIVRKYGPTYETCNNILISKGII